MPEVLASEFDIPAEEPEQPAARNKLPEPILPSDRDQPTGNWVTELAFEVALGYYSPEDLQAQYKLRPALYDKVVAMPDFQRAVKAYTREIDDEGIAFKLRARRSAALLLEELTTIAFNNMVDPKDRLKAIEMMCRYAGFEMQSKEGDSGTKILIQTNLSLNNGTDEKGVYTISVPKGVEN